jgi:hypothetical protein
MGDGYLPEDESMDKEVILENLENKTPVLPTFPNLSEHKHQYMIIVKQPDGSVKVEYSSTRPNP